MVFTLVAIRAGYIAAWWRPDVLPRLSLQFLTIVIAVDGGLLVGALIEGHRVGVICYAVALAWLAWCWWRVYKRLRPPRRRKRRLAGVVRAIKGRLVVVAPVGSRA